MRSATTVVPVARFLVARGAGMTHRGLVRERNEDSILTDPAGRLWAVADGMGGYGHGELASDIVIDSLETLDEDDDPAAALATHLSEANRVMRARAAEPGMGAMGATVVALVIDRGRAHVAWVGDSRVYLFRAGHLRLLTRDHSVVQELVDHGAIRAEDAEHHPESHVVTRAVGGQDWLEVENLTLPLAPGDRLLLCSDGLTRVVHEPVIAAVLGAVPDRAEACRALLGEALAGGAPDNVSTIVVDIAEG